MRYIVLALALCFTLAPVSAMAASQTVKVKAKRSKFKPQKPKKVKRRSHK
jgi:hypothetical protein